jgi:hypothetical protein
VWAPEVRHGLEALLPHEVLLITDRKGHDSHLSGSGKAVLTHGGESNVCHLLDSIIKLVAEDGSRPQCHGVKGYNHLDLTSIQVMGLKWTVVVEANIPIIAEADKCILHHLMETHGNTVRCWPMERRLPSSPREKWG